jgi:hypothetical protein
MIEGRRSSLQAHCEWAGFCSSRLVDIGGCKAESAPEAK